MTEPSSAEVDALFDYYFEQGCPCRFPRFRVAVARDLKEIGAPQWTVSDLRVLLPVFDRRISLRDVVKQDFQAKGLCEQCGAHVLRFGVPVFHDSFIERAIITPGPLEDVGAAVHGIAPIFGTASPAGAGSIPRHERERIQQAFPRLGASDWLAYMRELER